MNKEMEIWKRTLIKLEEEIKQLNNQKIILINILIELSRRKNTKLKDLLELKEEISYLD